MPVFHGVGVNWGVNSTIQGVNGAFQTRDHAYKVEKDQIRDGGDSTTSVVYYDEREHANFTYVETQFGHNFGNGSVDKPYIGEWVYVYDNTYNYITGWWICEDIVVAASNTSACRVTVALVRYPYVPRV